MFSPLGRLNRALERARAGALVYQPEPGRDLRIDLLRGFAVFAMVVDHLAGPSKLYAFTGGNRFYTSAAEAFIFISGLMVGSVYRRLVERDGLGPALRRLVERAWTLYLLSIALTLFVLPVSELLDLPWARGIDLSDPPELLWRILILHQTYYLVDIPLLYTILLAGAPIALMLMTERKTWLVLVGSAVIWTGHQIFPERSDIPWPISGNYLFYFSAWQLLFFVAMAMGYHQDRLSAIISANWRRPLLFLSGLGFLLLLLLFRFTEPVLMELVSADPSASAVRESGQGRLIELLFAKGDLRLGRIIASVVVFSFFFLLVTEFWRPLRKAFGWFFIPLGQHALYAYATHVVLDVTLAVVVTLSGASFVRSPSINGAIQLVGLSLIWIGIRFRVLYPGRRDRRLWASSPLALAVALLLVLPADPSPQLPGLDAAPELANAQSRASRIFGTPPPRDQPRIAPSVSVTPAPLPAPATPAAEPATDLGAQVPASEYVGNIHGQLLEITFYSETLEREMPYLIYLPPKYENQRRRYPVLYLLHGAGGHRDEWPAYGLVDTADQLIVSLDIRPLIIVMPQGDVSFWLNHINDGERWGDYLVSDIVQHVDANFRTLPDAEHRAVGGLSMGANGALIQTLKHPSVFNIAGVHSPSPRAEEDMGGLEDILGTGEQYAERDPVQVAATSSGPLGVHIWIDVGQEDAWLERVLLLDTALTDRGIAHEFHVLPGDHDGEYWSRNLVTYLLYYDHMLHWQFAD